MTRYGPLTMPASMARKVARRSGLMAPVSTLPEPDPDRMKVAPMMGVMTAPTELADCAVFSRQGAVSSGPRVVT